MTRTRPWFPWLRLNGARGLSGVIAGLCLSTGLSAQESGGAAGPQTADPPKLSLSTKSWDFGTRWTGQECQTIVRLRNTGGSTLRVVDVRANCGCTVPSVSGDLVAPGEDAELTIRYDTRRHTPQPKRTVFIQTNEPGSPTHEIQVTGQVRPFVEITPGAGPDFGQLMPDEKTSRTVVIRSLYSKPLDLRLRSVTDEAFRVHLQELEPGKRWQLDMFTSPPLPFGALPSLVFETGVIEVPELHVPVVGMVRSRVSITPETLHVPPGAPSAERTLRLIVRSGNPVQITAIEASQPEIQARVSDTPPKRLSKSDTNHVTAIEVKVEPIAAIRDGATLTIRTDDPECPELKVSVVVGYPKPN
jgi:hypothetical protein